MGEGERGEVRGKGRGCQGGNGRRKEKRVPKLKIVGGSGGHYSKGRGWERVSVIKKKCNEEEGGVKRGGSMVISGSGKRGLI